MPPVLFSRYVIRTTKQSYKREDLLPMWLNMFASIPPHLHIHGVDACVQCILWYAIPFYDNLAQFLSLLPEYIRHIVQTSLTTFNDDHENDYSWLSTAVQEDRRIFCQLVYRIRTQTITPVSVTPFKQTMVYNYLTYKQDVNVIDLAKGESNRSLRELNKIRRAYEHTILSTYNIDDVHSHGSPLKTIQRGTYGNSHISRSAGRKKHSKAYVIEGECSTLVLHKLKSSPSNHYRGCLELLCTWDKDLQTIYIDSREQCADPSCQQGYFFSCDTILLPRPVCVTPCVALCQRLRDFRPQARFENTCTVIPPETKTPDKVCWKERLYKTSCDEDFERNRVNSNLYVQDFLLWQISTSTTCCTK